MTENVETAIGCRHGKRGFRPTSLFSFAERLQELLLQILMHQEVDISRVDRLQEFEWVVMTIGQHRMTERTVVRDCAAIVVDHSRVVTSETAAIAHVADVTRIGTPADVHLRMYVAIVDSLQH